MVSELADRRAAIGQGARTNPAIDRREFLATCIDERAIQDSTIGPQPLERIEQGSFADFVPADDEASQAAKSKSLNCGKLLTNPPVPASCF